MGTVLLILYVVLIYASYKGSLIALEKMKLD